MQEPYDTRAGSSTITEQQLPGSVNPTRTKLIHEKNGDRIVEHKSLEAMASDGHYQPYLDIEKETIKASATTVHVVERSYGRDSDGRKQLVQVREQESRTLPGGEVETVRTTSNPDLNGGLRVMQKEVESTRSIEPTELETKTSVLIPDVNRGLAESARLERRETKNSDHTVQFQQSTLVQDGDGRWRAREVRQGAIQQNGKESTSEEKIFRAGSDGNMVVVQRTVRNKSAGPNGDSYETAETDSVDLPGVPYSGRLYPVERAISAHYVAQDGGESTKTQIEQPDPGSLTSQMRVTSRTLDVVQPGPGGISHETRTIQWRDGGGNLTAVWVSVKESTKTSDNRTQPAAIPAEAPAQSSPNSSSDSSAPKQ